MKTVRIICKPCDPDVIVFGLDPSLNGSAVTVLKNGEIDLIHAWTSKVRIARDNPSLLSWFKLPPKSNYANRQYRISLVSSWVLSLVDRYLRKVPASCIYFAIEGYAHSKRSIRTSDTAEMCGIIKQGLWERGVRLRVYDPKTVKMAWVSGNATKKQMMNACKSVSSFDFTPFGENPGSDLADSVLIAKLLQAELELKLKRVELEEQPLQIQKVMKRVTKLQSEPLVFRKFIHHSSTNLPEYEVPGVY